MPSCTRTPEQIPLDANQQTTLNTTTRLADELGRAGGRCPISATTALLSELRYADTIIKAMLNAMTVQQKARVAEKLEADGIVTDGMSRHHERRAVMEAAALAPTTIDSAFQPSAMLAIEAHACDAAAQAADIAHLLQAAFEKLEDLAAAGGPLVSLVSAANCFATCAARNAHLIRESTADIIALAQQGGAQ